MPKGTETTKFLRLKLKIRKATKVLEELKSESSQMEKALIIELENEKEEGSQVKIGSISIKKDTVFSADDWTKIWAYIFKKKDKSLVQKRLGQAYLKELLEEGITVPGIKKGTKKSLSVGFKKGL